MTRRNKNGEGALRRAKAKHAEAPPPLPSYPRNGTTVNERTASRTLAKVIRKDERRARAIVSPVKMSQEHFAQSSHAAESSHEEFSYQFDDDDDSRLTSSLTNSLGAMTLKEQSSEVLADELSSTTAATKDD